MIRVTISHPVIAPRKRGLSALWLLAGMLLMASCGRESRPGVSETPKLASWFDCLRTEGGVTIAAHRGGPSPGYPENALETLQHSLEQGLTTFEVDVAETADGVLFLMHDRSLNRTTTGSGLVEERTWAEVARERLLDGTGRVTDFRAPRLEEALAWAVEHGAVLELDRKSSTTFGRMVEVVREAGAEAHVILITYDFQQAVEVSDLAPDMVMTAGIFSMGDLRALLDAGVGAGQLVAWTGTNRPNPRLWKRLADAGIEAGFGTLGAPGERLDDRYAADGNPDEYQLLADDGLVLLATTAPLVAARVLEADDRALARCPVP